MPPLPSVANGLKCDLGYSIGDDTHALTRLHFLSSGGPPSGATLGTLAVDIANDWSTDLRAIFSSAVALTSVTLTDISSTSGAQGAWTGSQAGTRAGSAVPANVCVLMHHNIARRYRGGKPRSYVPFGVTGDLASPQTWGGAFTGNILTSWAAFIAHILAHVVSGYQLMSFVNVSYYSGFTNVPYGSPTKYRRIPTLRAGGPITDQITSSTPESRVASQRRRNLRSA
jgi:hypothetical protein